MMKARPSVQSCNFLTQGSSFRMTYATVVLGKMPRGEGFREKREASHAKCLCASGILEWMKKRRAPAMSARRYFGSIGLPATPREKTRIVMEVGRCPGQIRSMGVAHRSPRHPSDPLVRQKQIEAIQSLNAISRGQIVINRQRRQSITYLLSGGGSYDNAFISGSCAV